MRIIQYEIHAGDFELSMPEGARILSIQVVSTSPSDILGAPFQPAPTEHIRMWVLGDSEAPQTTRRFKVYGTSHLIEGDPGVYIGTYQIMRGNLVLHVFEETK